MHRIGSIFALAALAAVVTACGDGRSTASDLAVDEVTPERVAHEIIERDAAASFQAEESAPAARSVKGVGGAAVPPAPGAAVAGRPQDPLPSSASVMLIRTGAASVEVDSLETSIERLRDLARRLGGHVAGVSVAGGDRARRYASLELKVPVERFDAALEELESLGVVETVDVQAVDVGEEHVDLQARLSNALRLEERLLAILQRRGAELADVLAVERELARVREDVERIEGRLRYLESRAALATLSVTLHEPGPVVGDYPGDRPILDAFRTAGRNVVRVTAFLIASLGIVVPPLVVALALLWIARRRGLYGVGRRSAAGGASAG